MNTIADVLRRNAADVEIRDRPAILFGDRRWTHAAYVAECCRWAQLFGARLPTDRPRHVGVLMDNTPEYVFALGGAALAGCTVVSLNTTHRGEHLWRDIEHTDVALLVTEPNHLSLTEPFADRLDQVLVTGDDLDAALAAHPATDPGLQPDPGDLYVLIFTSGTSGAPKAVQWPYGRALASMAGLAAMVGLTRHDVAYMCMPLFHSQSLLVNWGPAMVAGAATAIARRFSASRWLSDIRRYGATFTNYTGKPLSYILATPVHPDDADNPLKVAFGNEGASVRQVAFAQRFGVRVLEAYGATEGAIGIVPDGATPVDSLGPLPPTVKVVDDHGVERPRARFDDQGRLVNPAECVGEIVNTAPTEPFEGYYKNPEATAAYTRNGWVWSGDLAYVDEAGFVYFAGRTAEWIRVGGENFVAAPVEAALARHPDVVAAAAYGVPDTDAGDQVMAALVLRDPVEFDGAAWAAWIDAQPDLSPTWRPRYLRITAALPMTPSNKVLIRELAHEKFRADRTGGDDVFIRARGDAAYRRFTPADEAALRAAFVAAERSRFWDL